jgi:hypothetical protein
VPFAYSVYKPIVVGAVKGKLTLESKPVFVVTLGENEAEVNVSESTVPEVIAVTL